MSWGNITDLPVLKYAAIQQATFAANMRENGKEPKTTFYGDLSIAEFYGPKDVQETFQRAKTDWGGNVEYWTEFVICLNWKIWQWYKKNDELAKLYNTLWEQADKFADAVVNTGAIPKVTPRGYDTPTGTEPREIRRYEFRRGPGFPQVVISVLEMLEETNPEY